MYSSKKLFAVLGGALTLTAALGLSADAQASTLYVNRTTGMDTRTRAEATSPTTPLLTIQKAIDLANQVDDVIEVAPTTSSLPYAQFSMVKKRNIKILGTFGANGTRAFVKRSAGNPYTVIRIAGCTNILIQSLDVSNTASSDSLDCNGIQITPSTDDSTSSTQIDIKYCTVHDVGGGGIVAGRDKNAPDPMKGNDYIRITGNEIYRTNTTGQFGSSGISLLESENSNNDTSRAYHNIIQTNFVHDNVNVNPDPKVHTDGNGIIMDTSKPNVPWSLIQNNIIVRNGGRGIHIFKSNNVDVLNNTCYQNVQDPVYFNNSDIRTLPTSGEICVVGYGGVNIKNVNVYNNLCSSRTATSMTPAVNNYVVINYGLISNTDPTKFTTYPLDPTVKLDHNSYWGGGNSFNADRYNVPAANVTNLFKIDPLFVNAAGNNFRLNGTNPRSLAIDAGTTVKYASGTFDGLTRPIGAGVDLGAYEQ